MSVPERNSLSRKTRLWLGLLLLALVAAGGILWNRFGSTPEPIRIGFVGGLTGRVADLGIAGRDGTILAVEECNRDGGIDGRPLELLIRDDEQNAQTARRVDQELLDAGAVAIIGHMTSAMSVATVPLANAARRVMISPTTSSNELSGLDDFFFRVYPSSAKAAGLLAAYAAAQPDLNSFALVCDDGNRAHSESWANAFATSFEKAGGRIVSRKSFVSGPETSFATLAKQLQGSGSQGILIIANAIDSAILVQQLHKLGNTAAIFTSEWSATAELLRLGGQSIEGVRFLHTFDPDNHSPRFLTFRTAFLKQFGAEPGFAATHAYDATSTLISALRQNNDPTRLKQTLLQGSYSGVQNPIHFDAFGDSDIAMQMMIVRDGHFLPATE